MSFTTVNYKSKRMQVLRQNERCGGIERRAYNQKAREREWRAVFRKRRRVHFYQIKLRMA